MGGGDENTSAAILFCAHDMLDISKNVRFSVFIQSVRDTITLQVD